MKLKLIKVQIKLGKEQRNLVMVQNDKWEIQFGNFTSYVELRIYMFSIWPYAWTGDFILLTTSLS